VVARDADLLAEQPEAGLGGDDDRRVGEVAHGEDVLFGGVVS
jgi:hypothetical protein